MSGRRLLKACGIPRLIKVLGVTSDDIYAEGKKGGCAMRNEISVRIDAKDLDEALEKANRLKELLTEVQELIYSLSNLSVNRTDY